MEEIVPGVLHWTARHPELGMEVGSHLVTGSGTVIDPLLPEGEADAVVARVLGETRDDEIADAREAGEGFLAAAEGHARVGEIHAAIPGVREQKREGAAETAGGHDDGPGRELTQRGRLGRLESDARVEEAEQGGPHASQSLRQHAGMVVQGASEESKQTPAPAIASGRLGYGRARRHVRMAAEGHMGTLPP